MENENVNRNCTNETIRAVQRWIHALDSQNRAKADLNRAECEMLNAINELGKFLTPEDAEPGEKFQLWYGDGILSVTKRVNDYTIGWRKQPSAKVMAGI